MKQQAFGGFYQRYTPWFVVRKRLFDDRSPSILAFAKRHNLDVLYVMRVFAGDIISFSLEMCAALSKETGVSKGVFLNLSNRWPPHPPPAISSALSPEGRFIF
jgi:hypothetical protein